MVRIQVMAAGVCGADLHLVSSDDPSRSYPIVPGHEIAGVVAAIGDGVTSTGVGDRVAVGWFGGSCGRCRFCRTGDPVHCRQRLTPGVDYFGGWAQFVTVPADAVARIPGGMALDLAAPFGCAGVTVFNALRRAQAPAGARVAVFGLGGLGHFAVQFAAAMGFEVIAIARGAQRRRHALQLGAHHYIDSAHGSVGASLRAVGGADLVLFTASDTRPAVQLLDGLNTHATMVLIGVDSQSLSLPVAPLVARGLTMTGHLTGSPSDVESALEFAVLHGIAPSVERLPLARAGEAVERLRAGLVRFRTVLMPWD